MSGGARGGPFGGIFGRRGLESGDKGREPTEAPEGVRPTRGLVPFLKALDARRAPIIVDLGPAVGANVSFLGRRLGCKIHVEDLFADLDRLTAEGREAGIAAYLVQRFPHGTGEIDGVLCWDILDYLPMPAAQVLVAELTRVLRPGGALLAMFGTAMTGEAAYTQYAIVDEEHLECRKYGAACAPRHVLSSGDIVRLFGGLRIDGAFLLASRQQELVFRKAHT